MPAATAVSYIMPAMTTFVFIARSHRTTGATVEDGGDDVVEGGLRGVEVRGSVEVGSVEVPS